MSRDLLVVQDLSAGYEGSNVIEGVSLAVREAETVMVLGPNGHGKTTLARAISGMIHPRAGTITFDGLRIEGLTPAEIVASGIVQIPQGDLLFPEMTVVENLLAAASVRRALWRDRHRRVGEVLDRFPQLKLRSNQRANTLSGGERRMLAIGRGLIVPSTLLVIDEPALGLSPMLVDEVYLMLREIQHTGRAILLIEESANHLELANRVHLLQNGALSAEAEPQSLFEDPRFVETYLLGVTGR